MDPRAVTLPYSEAEYDEDDDRLRVADEELRVAEKVAEQYGEQAVNMVPPYLRSLVAVCVQDRRELRELNRRILLRHRSRIAIPRCAPRRRGAGRPAARRTSTASRDGPGGDPDLPPGPKSPPELALVPRRALRKWARKRLKDLGRLRAAAA